jgi:hypothetical protein
MVCVGPSIAQSPARVADLLAALRLAHEAAATPPGAAVTFDRDRIETVLTYALGLAREQGLVREQLDVSRMFAEG